MLAQEPKARDEVAFAQQHELFGLALQPGVVQQQLANPAAGDAIVLADPVGFFAHVGNDALVGRLPTWMEAVKNHILPDVPDSAPGPDHAVKKLDVAGV